MCFKEMKVTCYLPFHKKNNIELMKHLAGIPVDDKQHFPDVNNLDKNKINW